MALCSYGRFIPLMGHHTLIEKEEFMDKKTILYLRTDYSKEKLIAGGSVSHTLGVIEGLLERL